MSTLSVQPENEAAPHDGSFDVGLQPSVVFQDVQCYARFTMTASRSLFERLRSGGNRSHFSEHDLDDLRHSICKNLERILNARSGMALCCETYGLPDMTQIIHGIPERAREIEQALERCIRDYEPRLSQVEVEHVVNPPDAMTACFKIRAAVATGKNAEEMWFETVVVSSGRVRLT